MKTTPEFNTGIAWDKLDRFVETKNVKDTLHDTVRMAYQMRDVPMTNLTAMHSEKSDNCTDSLPILQQQGIRQKQQLSQKNQGLAIAIDGTSDNKKSRKRRCAYEPTGLNIEPCHKKPKTVGTSFLPLNHPLRTNPEAQPNISKSCGKYILWLEDVATDTENSTPMWIGWNSNLIPSDDCFQEIWYLPQINQSPTSYAVVCQTMKDSLKISSECRKHNIAVTCDLARAKLALQRQVEESPEFDNIFVTLGPFHIDLAFFNACGKIISESGALHIFNESLVFAAGSINGFIKGKNYNKCKKIHELLSLAFEILLFQSYLAKIPNSEDVLDIIRSELNIIQKNQDSDVTNFRKNC